VYNVLGAAEEAGCGEGEDVQHCRQWRGS